MVNSTSVEQDTSLKHAQNNGIITCIDHLLSSRHWAKSLSLFSKKAAKNSLLGNVRSRYRGRGMEFDEVRRYQPGDDVRNIDWRVTARANGTYTKVFCEERERPCHIVVDQRSSLFFGSTKQFKSVLAAELAVAIGWAALAGGDRVGAQVIGDTQEQDSRTRRSYQAVLKLIHDLHEINRALLTDAKKKHTFKLRNQPQATKHAKALPARSLKLSSTLDECQRIVRPGAAIFLISDFYDIDDICVKTLANLGKHTDITLLHIMDPLERQLPNSRNLAISDGENTANITLSSQLANAYQQSLTTREALINKAAILAKAHSMTINTTQTARQALSQVYLS